MILNFILLIIGFFLLIKGANIFVDGASNIARNFKVSKIMIGLTIVAFGTSAPEFAISVKSIISGNFDIVLGNVIGSNILNVLFILGISSLFYSLKIKKNTVKREIPIMLLISFVFAILLSDNLFDSSSINTLSRSDGLTVIFFFLIFIYYLFSMEKDIMDLGKKDNEVIMPLGKAIFFTLLGIFMIFIGSNMVVDNASKIAIGLGVTDKMISLTIIALGTSLPELVTCVVAAKKKESDIAVGNIIGSNIFNIGLVIGVPVGIFGGINTINFNYIDLLVMLFSSSLLFIFSYNDRRITKLEGVLFLIIFIFYYSYVIISG